MKKTSIKVGSTYSNGRGRKRRVVDIGPQYKFYEGQMSQENLRYEVVCDGTKANRTAGEQHNMSLAAFAAWCKEEVIGDAH